MSAERDKKKPVDNSHPFFGKQAKEEKLRTTLRRWPKRRVLVTKKLMSKVGDLRMFPYTVGHPSLWQSVCQLVNYYVCCLTQSNWTRSFDLLSLVSLHCAWLNQCVSSMDLVKKFFMNLNTSSFTTIALFEWSIKDCL